MKIDGTKVTLRIAETNPKFVGRGVALLDPKVMDDLSTGVNITNYYLAALAISQVVRIQPK